MMILMLFDNNNNIWHCYKASENILLDPGLIYIFAPLFAKAMVEKDLLDVTPLARKERCIPIAKASSVVFPIHIDVFSYTSSSTPVSKSVIVTN